MPIGAGPLVAAAWVALALMLGLILAAGRDVLIPLALAVLLWQLVNAIAARYGRLRIGGRPPSGGVRLTLAVLTLASALWLVARLIVSNVGAVSAAAPAYEANLMAFLLRLAGMLGLPPPESLADLLGEIEFDAWIRSLSATLAAFASSIGLVALYVAFLLLEQGTFGRKLEALFPEPGKAAAARAVFADIERRIERYLAIKTLMSAATAFLSWCVLAAVGCGNAGFWALVVFILNYIPFLGSFLGVLLPTLLTLAQFGSAGTALTVAAGLAAIQFGLGNVIEPRLMGRTLNLSPVAIMASLAVWGSLWGIAGMFLCVPIMVSAMIACARFAPTRPLAILLSASGSVDEEAAA